MSAVIVTVAGRLKRAAKSFEPRLAEFQRTLKESSDCAAQSKRNLVKACADANLPRPHSVLRQLTSGLAVADCDPDEFFGLLVERLALPEYSELRDAIGFTALKEMTEFHERITRMLDVEKMFSSKKNDKANGSNSDDADGHVSLDDDVSVEQDFENEPESVTFIKVLFRLIYASSDWTGAIDHAVRVFDESSEDESGVDLGDEDTEKEDDDEDEDDDGEEKEIAEKENGTKVVRKRDDDFRPVTDDDEEFERRRNGALDRLLACMDREYFVEDKIDKVRERREEVRSKRESREAQILAAAEAVRREQEEAERQRREESKKAKHRRRKRSREPGGDGDDEHRCRHKHKRKRRRHRDAESSPAQQLLLQ